MDDEQSLIDRGAFEKFGKMPDSDKKHPYHTSYIRWPKNEDTISISKKTYESVQLAVWSAALSWERESPASVSNKRIKELNKVLE